MTTLTLFGCIFMVYGPAFAIFILCMMRDAQLVVISISAAFFWLVAMLLSSLWWFAVVPLRDDVWFGLLFAVAAAEGARALFAHILRRAEAFLLKMSSPDRSKRASELMFAVASGFGFGVMSVFITFSPVLSAATGPGSLRSPGCPSSSFFIISSLFALCFLLMNIAWFVIYYEATERRQYPFVVALLHFAVSALSLLNQNGTSCAATLVPTMLILLFSAAYAYYLATTPRPPEASRRSTSTSL